MIEDRGLATVLFADKNRAAKAQHAIRSLQPSAPTPCSTKFTPNTADGTRFHYRGPSSLNSSPWCAIHAAHPALPISRRPSRSSHHADACAPPRLRATRSHRRVVRNETPLKSLRCKWVTVSSSVCAPLADPSFVGRLSKRDGAIS
jgi:hypothetical protein